ncbi:lipoprotein [Peribacillus frigoritolerans]|jgi:ABC-type glycerol-3-phosphate transport system substrate-binding protein|uniref:lipoprotein n=1 Tax=Peribacillus frigoritolerans TaxID=450367 RepID=UPI003D033FB6
MKKLIFGIGVLTLLTGCSERMITYDGIERPESEVEEIIADKLEVENPNLDIEVNIGEETD